MNKNWYAIFVLGGQEERVKEKLRLLFSDKYEACSFYVPKRCLRERRQGKWKEVKRLLLPGYILMCGELTPEGITEILNIEGVVKILSEEEHQPMPIPERELRLIHNLLGDTEEVGFSTLLKDGEQIQVVGGPLFGLEGKIININARKGRAKVRMFIFGDVREIELGIQLIKPING